MDRLTRIIGNRYGVIEGCELNTISGAKAVVDRLAAYENTGLMPEEVYGFAMDVAQQFGYRAKKDGRLHLSTGGLSTLEWAFSIIGWEDPHPYPEGECEVEGCHEAATCGTQTDDGYKHVCSWHFERLRSGAATDKNVGRTIPVNDLYDEDGGDVRKGGDRK